MLCLMSSVESCVAAIGVVHFSVRSFGCALFCYTGGNENESKINYSSYNGVDSM